MREGVYTVKISLWFNKILKYRLGYKSHPSILTMVEYYLVHFFYSLKLFFYEQDFLQIPNTYIFLTVPCKQLWVHLVYLPTVYHKGYSVGQLLTWNFTRPKFFKKTLTVITPATLLLWHYFIDILVEMPMIFIKNFTFFSYSFLCKFFELVEASPIGLLVRNSYVLSQVKGRRIKKRIFKKLKFY